MEVNKILSSDLLDIIFEGRNKEYGAYELRKTYNNRMMKAVMITVGILSVTITGYVFANKFSSSKVPDIIDGVIILTPVPIEPNPEIVVPPKVVQPPKLETVAYVVPLIVKDYLVPDDQRPPENDALTDVVIGFKNIHGEKDGDIEGPPVVEDKRGVISIPAPVDDNDKIFRKVEIESNYPGGMSAWMRYLNKTFRYPSQAAEGGLQGTVTVQFIVDTDGNVSNVEAISGPESGGLREEAVRVIMKSGRWEPAIQNGRQVKSYKKQPITFKLESE